MTVPPKSFFVQALDALKQGDRRGAAALLERQLREGNTAVKNLPSVASLAAHIGEIDLALEASRGTVANGSPDALLAHWAMLATYGRAGEALAEAERQSVSVRDNPAVLHFRGTVATQFGRFDEAQALFRRALAKAPDAIPTWFALAMLKTFTADDPDFTAMARLEQHPSAQSPAGASLAYALGKACEDRGDIDRAFQYYARGAARRRQEGAFDLNRYRDAAEAVIRDFTAANLAQLVPSRCNLHPSLFVTGLPRSGTTLTEQILMGHSSVVDGAEVNLFGTAAMPTMGPGFASALAYQERAASPDPWGDIGRDYAHLIAVHFQSPAGLVVDKSLGQSMVTGTLLQALPDARIAWLRRRPEDVALSCFRTFFSTGLKWTSSLADIADYMRIEDRLFEHWRTLFPDRILVVPYEELARDPADWATRLQDHFGMPVEAGLEDMPREGRAVRTASVGQVREPISASRIGQAERFEQQLKPFRDRYYA